MARPDVFANGPDGRRTRRFIRAAEHAGAAAVVAPGFPRLKEWAYAGILFDLTGASVASATMGAAIGAEWWHVFAPLAVGAIMVGSWALRPPSRRLPGPAL